MNRDFQWTNISGTAAGSTVISTRNCVLENLVIGSNKEGTVTFYDTSTAAGTSADNLVFAINNNSGSIPTSINVNAVFRNGIVAYKGGTTGMTVIWG